MPKNIEKVEEILEKLGKQSENALKKAPGL